MKNELDNLKEYKLDEYESIKFSFTNTIYVIDSFNLNNKTCNVSWGDYSEISATYEIPTVVDFINRNIWKII